MAPQTGIHGLFRREFRERDDARFSAMGLDVRAAGTVTAFAPRIGGLFKTARNALKMRILVEQEPDVGVAGLANGAADK
jgi:hypothetical protein